MAELEARAAAARADADRARPEASRARVLYSAVKEQVIDPLNQAAGENHILEMVRDSLRGDPR
jgi:hypothetical protein